MGARGHKRSREKCYTVRGKPAAWISHVKNSKSPAGKFHQSKVVTKRGGNSRGNQTIPAIHGGIARIVDIMKGTPDHLSRHSPPPMASFVADAQAANMEITIRNKRGIITIRS